MKMDRMQRAALLLNLADRLKERRSWCGERNLQKAVYFLQEMLKVPLGYEFVLYWQCPYSFEFRDELTSLRADMLLTLDVQHPSGPNYVTTELGKKFQERFTETLNSHEEQLNFLEKKLEGKRGRELKILATALYITLTSNNGEQSVSARAEELIDLNQFFPFGEAFDAVEKIDLIREDWKSPADVQMSA